MSADVVSKVLAKGHVCFGIFDGPVLASVGWYSNVPTSADG